MSTAAPGTGTSLLTGWLAEPRSDHALCFADDECGWRDCSYDELAALARGAAAQIAASGGGPGSTVMIVLPTGADFVAAFYGTLLAGATPCPIAPHGYFSQSSAYREHLSRVVDGARPSVVLTDEFLLPEIQTAIEGSSVAVTATVASFDTDAAPDLVPLPETALLQYTSGSSGHPRGVRVTAANLETHLAMASAFVGHTPDQIGAFWIPLYHDMGLVGGLLTGIAYQQTMYWLRPDQFVRRPLRWIDCMGRLGATLTSAPTFAYAYAAKRVAPEEIAGMDLSGMRFVGMGAERVDVQAVRSFADRFGPRGFETSAFCTGYGLAEATLTVACCPVGEEPRAALVDWRGLRFGERLDVQCAPLAQAAASESPGEWLLGCGPPMADEITVNIVDEEGRSLPDGHLGEVVVSGPTVAAGYVGGDGRPSPIRDGVLHTADAGFVLEGDLYVLGRIGDMITVHGRNVYVEDLEARLGAIGLPKGRFAVVAGPEQLLAIVESPPGPWADEAARLLARHVGEQYAVTVLSVERGSIERTSSGKPRRRSMWQSFSAGALGGTVVREAGEPGSRPPGDSPA